VERTKIKLLGVPVRMKPTKAMVKKIMDKECFEMKKLTVNANIHTLGIK
jgi:hypothetical protein